MSIVTGLDAHGRDSTSEDTEPENFVECTLGIRFTGDN